MTLRSTDFESVASATMSQMYSDVVQMAPDVVFGVLVNRELDSVEARFTSFGASWFPLGTEPQMVAYFSGANKELRVETRHAQREINLAQSAVAEK